MTVLFWILGVLATLVALYVLLVLAAYVCLFVMLVAWHRYL